MGVLAGAVLWVVMSACGLGAPTPIMFDEPLPDDPGPDVGGRALQEEIFADGVVTAAEYERAFRAGVECQRNAGFDVRGPFRDRAAHLT